MNNYSFLITNDSVTVTRPGHPSVTVKKGAANFAVLRAACVADDGEAIEAALTTKGALLTWAKGDFTVDGEVLKFKGEALPAQLNKRILEMVAKNESPEPFMKFWERLQLNPSSRSVEQLFPFLEHQGIPLTTDGCFLAYKGVTNGLKDCHTETVDNSPGVVNEMPRNKISDDPKQGCHFGYHVGALQYAVSFGSRCVICKVDPADVVCIPYDHSFQKMRVCKYVVEGFYSGQMSSTVHEDDTTDDTTDDEDEGADTVYYDSESAEQEHNELELVVDNTKQEADIKVAKKWRKIHAMGLLNLLEQPISRLREYAGKCLKIVGASKIPGGKSALISKIVEIRNGNG